MPLLKNAKKALRASQKRQVVNTRVRSRVKTYTDRVKKSNDLKDLPMAFSAIDKAVKKNLLHKNKAARLKSQLARFTKKVASASDAPKKVTTTKKAKATKKAPAKKASPKK